MASLYRITATTLASTLLLSSASAQDCKFETLKTSYPSPKIADDWSYSLIATELRRPRGLTFDSKGALIVIDSGNGIIHFELEDGGGTCLHVKKQTTLLRQNNVSQPYSSSLESPLIIQV